MKKKGLTLIELVVVVAIFGIVAAIVIPNISQSRQQKQIVEKMQHGGPFSKAEITKLMEWESNGIADRLIPRCQNLEIFFKPLSVKVAVYFLDPSVKKPKVVREVFSFENSNDYAINWTEKTLTIKKGLLLPEKWSVEEKTINFLAYYRFPKE